MFSSRQELLNSTLRDGAAPVRDKESTFQPDYDPEPDYDEQYDGEMDTESFRGPAPPVYDHVTERPRHPPEAFNEMVPWAPSSVQDDESTGPPDDTDAFKKDPRLVLSVGPFLDEGQEDLPEPSRYPLPREYPRDYHESPQSDRRYVDNLPQPSNRYADDPRDVPEQSRWLMQPEVYDMSPRRRSSAFANNVLDPLRRRRSSGRVGMYEPNRRRRSSDHGANFDSLNNRRRSSLPGLGYEDENPDRRNLTRFVRPRQDSVYSVGSAVARREMYPEEDESYRGDEFVPEDTIYSRAGSESTNHYTMLDVVSRAREMHLIDEYDRGETMEPAEEIPQENEIPVPDGFDNVVRRQCWARYCQSQSYHAHVMRRTGGVTTARGSRERAQSASGRHGTRNASWHINQPKTWVRFKERLAEIFNNFVVWHHSLKHIEGHFGTSIASYFVFIRWLFLLNVVIFVIMFGFVAFPYFLQEGVGIPADDCSKSSTDCVKKDKMDETADKLILHFLQGTGWLERTSMFMGMYHTITLNLNGMTYDLPLAYLLATVAVLLLSLILMLKSTAKGIKESAITSEGNLYNYCNTVFGGWDFCINKDEAATLKHEMLKTELISCLEDEKQKFERQNRTRREKMKLYAIRAAVWLVILAMLGSSGYGIYLSSEYALEQTNKTASNNENITTSTTDDFLALVIEYLPSIVITSLNMSLPLFFYGLIVFERYSPATVVKVNLFRTLLLRLASIGVLLYAFQTQIHRNQEKNEGSSGSLICWETYIGQQLYKLVLLDFIVIVFLTFGVGLLRMVLTTKVYCFAWVGQEEFDIPKHVLDLVYSQTLCWLGTFFSPLLPAACVVKCLFMFYIKKFHLFVNCIPSRQPYRASKSNAVFITVLLISFSLFALVPFVYTIAELKPSHSCGPFRTKHYMWQTVEEIHWPDGFSQVFAVVGSTMVAVPVVIVLLLTIYYYYTISSAYKNMSVVLKEHLRTEGQDKTFLLERLKDVLNQAEQTKRSAQQPTVPMTHYETGDSSNVQGAYF